MNPWCTQKKHYEWTMKPAASTPVRSQDGIKKFEYCDVPSLLYCKNGFKTTHSRILSNLFNLTQSHTKNGTEVCISNRELSKCGRDPEPLILSYNHVARFWNHIMYLLEPDKISFWCFFALEYVGSVRSKSVPCLRGSAHSTVHKAMTVICGARCIHLVTIRE